MGSPILELKELTKRYDRKNVVDKASATLVEGEFFSMVGPSGSGKTTILRMIAGLTPPDGGRILLNGKDITALPPEKRHLGLVFQNYAIFPHLTVARNIAFGLKIRRTPKTTIDNKVREILAQVGLSGSEKKYPHQMSGGEKQRVALGRAVATNPELLLLDEPLSALDRKLREEMKFWLRSFQESLGTTTVYVTHDQSEALSMSDRVLVLNAGRIEQIAHPNELYQRPASPFVADFIGLTNHFPATVRSISRDRVKVALDFGPEVEADPSGHVLAEGDRVHVFVKPETVELACDATRANESNTFYVDILQRSYEGALLRYRSRVEEAEIEITAINTPANMLEDGCRTLVFLNPHGLVVLPLASEMES